MNGKRKGDDDLAENKRKEPKQNGSALEHLENETTNPNQTASPLQPLVQGQVHVQVPLPSHPRPPPVEAHHSVLPLSMQLMRPFWSMNCVNCAPGYGNGNGTGNGNGNGHVRVNHTGPRIHAESTPSFIGRNGEVVGDGDGDIDGSDGQFCSPVWTEQVASASTEITTQPEEIISNGNANGNANGPTQLSNGTGNELRNRHTKEIITEHKTHLLSIAPSPKGHTLPILQEYIGATQMYGCQVNPGVLTALRFSLPILRVSGSFHDSDMLALSEVLFRHCNGALKHIRRLDFSIAARFGKLHGRKGFGSHGAFTLSRVLCISRHIEEVFVQLNKIGPYGAAAIFAAASKNMALRNVVMRRCNVGERGALAFVEHVGKSKTCGLKEIDLSVNGIGFRGSIEIEQMLIQREDDGDKIEVDLEGNLVIQESESLYLYLHVQCSMFNVQCCTCSM